MRLSRTVLPFAPLIAALAGLPAQAGSPIYTTYLWHLHQPIYWPDKRAGTDHYEAAWDTIREQDLGRDHPAPENLRSIFGVDDRVAVYQSRVSDTLASILGLPNAGAQVSYSGALMENVQSLGAAGELGYSHDWYLPNRRARSWTTSGGKPRLDLVNFTYHHALAPLVSDETLEMELRIQKRHMEILWGNSPGSSKGYFPAEMAFSERMIPVLKKLGIDWAIVSNSHLARASVDFPLVLGSGGENCDIPNRADQLNPAQGAENYRRLAIERGVAPAAPMPFAYRPHRARYVDPRTGKPSELIVVPSDQALSWRDSYGTWDPGLMSSLEKASDPAHPPLVLLAHDGDNAWSGGYSYYNEWVSEFAGKSRSFGYEPTTVEQYLEDHPVAPDDFVHVEDGPWVFADGDFGSPEFLNWHWPPSYRGSDGTLVVDPSRGVSDKADVWRVIVATENRVKTAQQVSGITPRIDQVRDPGSYSEAPNAVELGWHYYLAGLDSGFVYYGCHDDECLRPIKAQENAVRNVDPLLLGSEKGGAPDLTPPTLFIPQRHPWNPGGRNFGPQYGYRPYLPKNTDFFVWTYAYDVSGIGDVSLFYRSNGPIPPRLDDTQFATYAGGPKTGAWSSLKMNLRSPAPVLGANPRYIADYYWAKVHGFSDSYVDYYLSATDLRGNTVRSPIQHVYVGRF